MKDKLPKILIVFTILYLENFLEFVSTGMIYFPIAAGISLNIRDILILGFIAYYIFSKKKDRVSPQLKLLLIYLAFCLFAITLMSIFAYGATPGAIGRRLSQYMSYVLIVGLVMLVDGNKHLRFFIGVIFVVGLLSCFIHFMEFAQGSYFSLPLFDVSNKYFTGEPGSVEGLIRIWNRASSTTMIMFLLSAVFLTSNIPHRKFFIIPFIISLASIALAMVRTLYVFAACTLVSVFIVNLLRKEGKPFLLGVILSIIAILSPVYIFKKHPEMFAVIERFQTIYSQGFEAQTMTSRQRQIEFFKNKMLEADIPPVFGLGITNESAKYKSTDLGFMNIIINMGLLGIFFIFCVFIYLYQKSRYVMLKSPDDLGRAIGSAVFCMLPGLFIIGINFDYITYTHFTKLLLPVVLLEAAWFLTDHQSVNMQTSFSRNYKV